MRTSILRNVPSGFVAPSFARQRRSFAIRCCSNLEQAASITAACAWRMLSSGYDDGSAWDAIPLEMVVRFGSVVVACRLVRLQRCLPCVLLLCNIACSSATRKRPHWASAREIYARRMQAGPGRAAAQVADADASRRSHARVHLCPALRARVVSPLLWVASISLGSFAAS
ncbi:hypothetical protein IE81DRAFT_4802 [Ceraceosorus guamensis]|uniref:Uncharacterized protein n=1 Tax=Ceraceosorus guamensis TaxID=1522189 RepID=A0A316W8S9_9BASI|nr:hypothetical protein IE81DRAFT_4802 [Ceraceosorus guamensis]PWN46326.1 hypothetical protein IE81DRAFT_4802 [Ceraceosorus guamensis]